MTNNAKICQLKITLNSIQPPIWRRVQVPGEFTLAKLHRVIQAVMGWHSSHLHQFIVGKTFYGDPGLDEFSELNLKDHRKVRLGQVLSKPPGPARPRTAVGLEAMNTSWKRFSTQITKSTTKCWNGSAANSTRKSSASCW